MVGAELSITPSEATQLFEEKVTRLRGEMGHAQRAAQDAMGQRDAALHEVTTLQQDKTTLMEELAHLTQKKQHMLEALAEHRKNVEASLTQQEAKAMVVIEQAAKDVETAKASARSANQHHAQVAGLKQGLKEAALTLQDSFATIVQKTLEALEAIPDQAPNP